MTDRIGIAIHHQKSALPPREHEVRGIVIGLRRLFQKMRIAIFLLEIFDPPGAPEGLDLGFGKFHRLVRAKT